MNVGKSKVMRLSRYVNWGRTYATLNGEAFEEVDCYKHLGSQMALMM